MNDWREATISANVLPGWEPLVDTLFKRVKGIAPELQVSQVKQKFGALRFYYSLPKEVSEAPDESQEAMWTGRPQTIGETVREVVRAAETASGWICECCGQAGAETTPSKRGWLNTLCAICTSRRDEQDMFVWQIAEEIRGSRS